MSLLFPLGLAALAAWLLPLLIHLARRHPYTPLDFAALRWLRAQVPAQVPIFFLNGAEIDVPGRVDQM